MNVRPFRAVLGATLTLIFAGSILAATSADDIASLRAKAEAGNAIAQYNLGLIYADEDEPAHNLIEAYVWLSRAADNGARGRQLDILAERLTPAQIAQANRSLGSTTTSTPAVAPFTSVPLNDSNAQIARLESERNQLAQELNQARADLQSLRASGSDTNAELRKRVAIAETALDNREAQIALLKTEIATSATTGPSAAETQLRQERLRLTSEINATTAELASLRAQNLKFRQQLETLIQSSTNDQARIENLSTELNAQRTEADQLRTRVAELNDELTVLNTDTADLDSATNRVSDLLAQLATARESEESHATELAAANHRIENLSAEVAAAWQESTEIEQRLANGAAAAARVGELETELTAARTELGQLQQAKAQSSNSNSAQIARLQSELQAARSEITSSQNQLTGLTAERDELAARSEDATAQVTALSTELTALRQQNDGQLSSATDRVAELQIALDASRAENTAQAENVAVQQARTQEQLEVAENQVNHLTTELATSRANLAQLRDAQNQSGNDASAQIATLQSDLQDARDHIAVNQTQMAAVSKERNALAAQLQAAGNQVAELSQELTQSRTSVTDIRAEQAADSVKAMQQVDALQSQLDLLSAENEALADQAGAVANTQDNATELTARIESLTADQQALQTELADAKNHVTRLENQIENERGVTDPAVLEAETEIASLREALESAQSESLILQGELIALEAKAAPKTEALDPKLQTQLDASVRAFAVQEREMVRLREQLDDATARADASDATLTTLRDEISSLQVTVAESEQLATANAERAESAEVATTASADSNSALQEQLESAQIQVAHQTAEIELLQAELTAQANAPDPTADLTAQNISLREEARLARGQAAAQAQEVSSLRTRLAIAQPAPITNMPGRARPSRPSDLPPAIMFTGNGQTEIATDNTSPAITANLAPTVERSTTPRATGPQRHTILSGESLSTIARDYYGDGNRWPEIFAANRESIPNANRLRAGTPIVIP